MSRLIMYMQNMMLIQELHNLSDDVLHEARKAIVTMIINYLYRNTIFMLNSAKKQSN